MTIPCLISRMDRDVTHRCGMISTHESEASFGMKIYAELARKESVRIRG